ncbi:unnamed protein product [Caenorhabditis angaria]|uniref:trimethyllysine dioxygenase n=1 Tax=Caenorhabditis angaria TaxID=860376 RepID=A0A9P1IEJ3_9PELO|nr:unnamed protein product [Caenorhabditis angaria]
MFSRRYASTFITTIEFRTILNKNDAIELSYHPKSAIPLGSCGPRQKSLILPLVWLRDHCQSEKCYNLPTHQRKANGTQIFSKSAVENVKNSQDSITVKWKDGHESIFEVDNLIERALKGTKPQSSGYVELWDSKTLKNIPKISKIGLEFRDFARNLARFGVVIVENVKETAEATEELCKSLVPVHDTFFGQFWTFSNSATKDEPAYEDTAYGNDGIGPHTDGTYFDQTPGIQVFHCLQPAENGGKTVLVDSWRCANDLKKEHFEILSHVKIGHHYLEGTPAGSSIYSLSEEKPVIEVDSSGNIKQIRNYSRSLKNIDLSSFLAEKLVN